MPFMGGAVAGATLNSRETKRARPADRFARRSAAEAAARIVARAQPVRNSRTSAMVSSGCSNCGTWPQSARTTDSGVGDGLDDVLLERRRAPASRGRPTRTAPARPAWQPIPEAVLAVRRVEVDLAHRGVERPAMPVVTHDPEVLVGGGVIPGVGQPVGLGEVAADRHDDQRGAAAERRDHSAPAGAAGPAARTAASAGTPATGTAAPGGRPRSGQVRRGLDRYPAAE